VCGPDFTLTLTPLNSYREAGIMEFVNTLLGYFISALSRTVDFFYSCHGAVNLIDTWWYNYKIRQRSWRNPQLCHFSHQKYGNMAELRLLGQRVIVITDELIARKLMTLHGHSLKQRFGSPDGHLINI